MRKCLLVVDLQKQFSDRENNNREYEKCLAYIRENAASYDGGIVATLFKQDSGNSNFKKHLNWSGCENADISDLEFFGETGQEIRVITKNGYGDSSKDQVLIRSCFELTDRIDIIGCDADACVLAICFQLWDAGFTNLNILTDYIYTTADTEKYGISKEVWVNFMRRNFGDCVVIKEA